MKVKTFLPIFPGFYNTIFEFDYNLIDSDINEARKEKGLFSNWSIDDLKIDYSRYELDIVKGFCDILPDFLSDYIIGIELETIVSPKKYNFSNDSANVIIETRPENIQAFIYSHKKEFSEYLKARYTSCDGFISHYSNNFEAWESETENFLNFNVNGHFLGAVLEFIARIENITAFDISDRLEVYPFEYIDNYDEIVNQSDGSLFEMLTQNNFSKDWADYIETSFQNNVIESLSLDEKTLSIIQEYKNLLALA
jgi:hypothetical protein